MVKQFLLILNKIKVLLGTPAVPKDPSELDIFHLRETITALLLEREFFDMAITELEDEHYGRNQTFQSFVQNELTLGYKGSYYEKVRNLRFQKFDINFKIQKEIIQFNTCFFLPTLNPVMSIRPTEYAEYMKLNALISEYLIELGGPVAVHKSEIAN
jgi:hypothetical protein